MQPLMQECSLYVVIYMFNLRKHICYQCLCVLNCGQLVKDHI